MCSFRSRCCSLLLPSVEVCSHSWIRWLMIVSAVLAFGGLSGVVSGDMQLRNIDILGYVPAFLGGGSPGAAGSFTNAHGTRSADLLSPSERPRDHQRKLLLPEGIAVRPRPLVHHDVRTCVAQCAPPPSGVLEKERLLRAGDQVRARNRVWHHGGRSVAAARRGAEDRTVDIGMPEPDGEREFSARRNTEHRGTAGERRESETGPHPPSYVLDEEPLMCGEPLRIKVRRVLAQPQRLTGHAMCTDNHRDRHARSLEASSPLRDQLAITGEHDRLWRLRWNVRGYLPATVVLERLGDEPSGRGHFDGSPRWPVILRSCLTHPQCVVHGGFRGWTCSQRLAPPPSHSTMRTES